MEDTVVIIASPFSRIYHHDVVINHARLTQVPQAIQPNTA